MLATKGYLLLNFDGGYLIFFDFQGERSWESVNGKIVRIYDFSSLIFYLLLMKMMRDANLKVPDFQYFEISLFSKS